jgi:hypothetical protein
MKKTLTISMLLLLSLLVVTGVQTSNATDRATLMWGTSSNYTAGERTASEDTSAMIEWLFNNNGQYNYCEDYWGDATQQSAFYGNVSDCAQNYDYATFYYKGHGWWDTNCPQCDYIHVAVWDNESCSSGDAIWDYAIYQEAYQEQGCQPKIFRFVCLWSCSNDWVGAISGSHCAGMVGAWFNRTDLSLDAYPYAGSDDSDVCYLGFEGVSMDFTTSTGYSSYTYDDFCVTFYDYALDPGAYTIRLSLYYASYDTIGCSYSLSDLYQGYEIGGVDSRQVLYGDAHEDLPD